MFALTHCLLNYAETSMYLSICIFAGEGCGAVKMGQHRLRIDLEGGIKCLTLVEGYNPQDFTFFHCKEIIDITFQGYSTD